MKDNSVLSKDEGARKCLVDYFKYTVRLLVYLSIKQVLKTFSPLLLSPAKYIVVASKYMRSDQVCC